MSLDSKHRKGLDQREMTPMTVANTIPAPNTADTDETRAALRTRAFRGFELHEARGSEIVRTGPFTYLVPSCSEGSRSGWAAASSRIRW